MGQITRDGVTFDSAWIEEKVAQFQDKSKTVAERLHNLKHAIAEREEDCKSMQQKMPNDREALAACGACLDAFRQTEKELLAGIITPAETRRPLI